MFLTFILFFFFIYHCFLGTFKENEVEVDAMEEEMGAAAAADADHERVGF